MPKRPKSVSRAERFISSFSPDFRNSSIAFCSSPPASVQGALAVHQRQPSLLAKCLHGLGCNLTHGSLLLGGDCWFSQFGSMLRGTSIAAFVAAPHRARRDAGNISAEPDRDRDNGAGAANVRRSPGAMLLATPSLRSVAAGSAQDRRRPAAAGRGTSPAGQITPQAARAARCSRWYSPGQRLRSRVLRLHRSGRPSGEDRVGEALDDQFNRANAVVVARNRQIDFVRVAIRVNQGNRRDSQPA